MSLLLGCTARRVRKLGGRGAGGYNGGMGFVGSAWVFVLAALPVAQAQGAATGGEIASALNQISDFIFSAAIMASAVVVALTGLRIAVVTAANDHDDDLAYTRSTLIRQIIGMSAAIGLMFLAPRITNAVVAVIGDSVGGVVIASWLAPIYNQIAAIFVPVGKALFSLALTVEGAKHIMLMIQNWESGDEFSGVVANKVLVMGILLGILQSAPYVVSVLTGR